MAAWGWGRAAARTLREGRAEGLSACAEGAWGGKEVRMCAWGAGLPGWARVLGAP